MTPLLEVSWRLVNGHSRLVTGILLACYHVTVWFCGFYKEVRQLEQHTAIMLFSVRSPRSRFSHLITFPI